MTDSFITEKRAPVDDRKKRVRAPGLKATQPQIHVRSLGKACCWCNKNGYPISPFGMVLLDAPLLTYSSEHNSALEVAICQALKGHGTVLSAMTFLKSDLTWTKDRNQPDVPDATRSQAPLAHVLLTATVQYS